MQPLYNTNRPSMTGTHQHPDGQPRQPISHSPQQWNRSVTGTFIQPQRVWGGRGRAACS